MALSALFGPQLFSRRSHARRWTVQHAGTHGHDLYAFPVVFLFRMHAVEGVIILMIGLLVVQILVVHFCGIEPRMRRLGEIQ